MLSPGWSGEKQKTKGHMITNTNKVTLDVEQLPTEQAPLEIVVQDTQGNRVAFSLAYVPKAGESGPDVAVPPATTFNLTPDSVAVLNEARPRCADLARHQPDILHANGTMFYLGYLAQMNKETFDAKAAGQMMDQTLLGILDRAVLPVARQRTLIGLAVACHMESIAAGGKPVIGGAVPAIGV